MTEAEDEYLWLEDVEGERSLEWATRMNAQLGYDPKSSPLYQRLLDVYDSKDKIPYVSKRGEDAFYNFWKDDVHKRGILRRTTLAEYKTASPKWETVFDVDAFNEADGDGKNKWVYKGYVSLDEGPEVDTDLVLLALSRGGADAVVYREFSLAKREFIDEKDNAFLIPEAKTRVTWKDRDTLLVGTDLGEDSLTDSGYPRTIREWKRGTKLEDAELVFEGQKADVSVSGRYYRDGPCRYEIYHRAITFYTYENYVKVDGERVKIQAQEDADVDTYQDHLLFLIKTDWGKYKAGSLLAVPFDAMIQKQENIVQEENEKHVTVLFEPTPVASLEGYSDTKNFLILSVLDDVKTVLVFWNYDINGQVWTRKETNVTSNGKVESISAHGFDKDFSDLYWTTSNSYDQPTTLSIADASGVKPTEVYKQMPHFYDAKDVTIRQHKAKSKDGTLVNYFEVYKGKTEPKDLPTILYGYGGFEVSLTPGYQATVGIAWLEKGNVYCVANIRGGGEYGPQWHKAALKANRNKAYEDFEAVAQDLIRRKVTSPQRLGCSGGSNGGLLVGNMLVRSSALFGAILCAVPLLDMKRYSKLLAGASWMAEYGDPDKKEEWAFLKQYSPYHNLDKSKTYSNILFTTSTRDDRVHPSHARKMAKKMIDYGFGDKVHYYENIEGGHGGASTNDQVAFQQALGYMFMDDILNRK